MTIGLITPYFPDHKVQNSGIANHYMLLAEALIQSGNKVVIIYIRERYEEDTKSFDEIILTNGAHLLTYKVSLPDWSLRFFKNKWSLLEFLIRLKSAFLVFGILNKVINRHRIDVIESSSYFSLCYLFTILKPKIPIVIRVSTTFSQMMASHYKFQSRLFNIIGQIEIDFIKRSKYLITHAENHAFELKKLYQIDSNSFTIIPHGISLPSMSKLKTSPNSPLRILYVGRLEYRKGTDILLKAIPLVLSQNPEAVFELIGADLNKYEADFRLKNSKDINEKVEFRGQINDDLLNRAYATCDIFVAPSRYESFGLIYIEAMSYAKPVIGCNVGGVNEIIEDQINGLFSLPEDAMNLANKINFLIENETIRLQMGTRARKTVISKFTKEILAEKSLKFYKKILKN